ncbi:MAG: Xaa-Pro peptidase family protein [Actinobacteria bacterium]|nr:Xaa-Pro peptidase family protein [Actinomycetota bacterium]
MKHEALREARTDSLLVTHLPNIRYLTGFTGSAGCVFLSARQQLFFTDFRYRAQSASEVRKGFKIHITGGPALEGAVSHISRRLKPGMLGFEGQWISQRQFARLRRSLKGVRLKDAGGAVERLRTIKSAGEQRLIRRACAIADTAFEQLVKSRVTGKTEAEIAWMLESVMRQAGSGPLPFPVIAASGPRSAMPHGVASPKVIKPGELLVVDLGASVNGYCSDETRTFATGRLPQELMDIYRIVKEARRQAMAAVSPGASGAGIDSVARSHIADRGYAANFGHSLGHGVGLEPHEGPVLSSRSGDILQEGMTVTVEPGIYLESRGGVRIEDTVLVGKNGARPLTRFPDELIVLR